VAAAAQHATRLTRVIEVGRYAAISMLVRNKQATEEALRGCAARCFSAAASNGDIPAGGSARSQ